jgi:hypothetical protein
MLAKPRTVVETARAFGGIGVGDHGVPDSQPGNQSCTSVSQFDLPSNCKSSNKVSGSLAMFN